MTLNPYEPAADFPEDPGKNRQQSDALEQVSPPRFQGQPFQLDVSITEEDALWHIRHAVPIVTSGSEAAPVKQATPVTTGHRLFVILAILGSLLVVVFFRFNRPPPPVAAPGLNLSVDSTLLFIFAGLLFSLFVFITAGVAWSRIRLQKADPSVGGKRTLKFSRLGISTLETYRDGRTFEAICSWRQASIEQSQAHSAWILDLGIGGKLVLLREWFHSGEQQEAIETLFTDIAQWQLSQSPILNLASIPDEAMEAFPEASREGITFSLTTPAEQELHRALPRVYRRVFPGLNSSGIPRAPWLIRRIGIALILGSFIAFLLLSGQTRLVLLFVPGILIYVGFQFWFRRKIAVQTNDNRVEGHVGHQDIWFNYRSVLIRQPFGNFSGRYWNERSLLLESQSKKVVILLGRSYFNSDEQYQAAIRQLKAKEIDKNGKRIEQSVDQ